MNILFDLDYLLHYPYFGIAVYLGELIKHGAEIPNVSFTGCFSTANLQNICRLRQIRDEHFGKCYSQRIIPVPGRIIRQPMSGKLANLLFTKDMDLYHCIYGILPPWYRPGKIPTIATVHDMVFMRYPEKLTTQAKDGWHRKEISKTLSVAEEIISVSEFTRRETIECLKIDPKKIVTIPLAAQFSSQEAAEMPIKHNFLHKHNLEARPFFLSVSVISPRKNYNMLLDVWEEYHSKNQDSRLVIVGRPGWNCDAMIKRIQSNKKSVIHLKEISAPELITLYRQATGYFNLSYYEGFGIPLLEAMTCGCPCCYVKGSSMDEIGKDAAIKVHKDDKDAVLRAFELFAAGGQAVENLRQRQLAVSSEFSWDKTVEKTISLYRKHCC